MNKAKHFIEINSKEFSEAIYNGYDIRMDEDEILEWMQKYANSEVEKLNLHVFNDQRELLFAFLLYLNDKKYINDYDLNYEQEINKFCKRTIGNPEGK